MITLYRDVVELEPVNGIESHVTGRAHARVGFLPIPLWFAMWWLGVKEYVR